MWQDGLNATGKSLVCVCVILTRCTYIRGHHLLFWGFFSFSEETACVNICQRVCGQLVTCSRSQCEPRPPLLLRNCQLVSHISVWSVTETQLLWCETKLISSQGRLKRQADRRIKTTNQASSPYYIYITSLSSYPSPSLPPPPLFLSSTLFVSLFPASLPPYLSISIILLPVIAPLSSPCHHHHHYHASCFSLSLHLSPLCPSLFPPSLLKPVKGYWAPLSIRSNSIRSLPYESFFFYYPNGPWLLLPQLQILSRESRQGAGGMDVSVHWSSLSRSTTLKGNLFSLMAEFV